MKTAAKHTTKAVAAAVIALAGASLALERAAGPAFTSWIATAYAQEHTGGPGGGETGGHDSGAESGGSSGHGSGGMGGGHSGGMGGGHEPGAETGGEEAKGHGTRYQHQGHGSGRHGSTSSHESGGDRFGGGSGLAGNAQVPEGVGRYGAGISASASSDLGRFRYWGGWTLPSDPNDPTLVEPTLVTTELTPGPGGGPSVNARSALDDSPRCEGVGPGMPAAKQLGGSNLLRLHQARALVDPSVAQSGKIASPYLMANLQEQLVKGTPSTELAGTYLGLVAKAPVSAETVKKVGFQLCARVSDAEAKEIARVAEQQRAALVAAVKMDAGGDNAKPR
jgi:hypothetical protein